MRSLAELDDMAGLGAPAGRASLTDLVTVMGVLDVVWEWRQRVQVILPLSQQACRGEGKHEGVPRGDSKGPRDTSGAVRQACKRDPHILQPDSDLQDPNSFLNHDGPYTPWSYATSLASWLLPALSTLLPAPGPLPLTLPGLRSRSPPLGIK